MRQRPGTSNQEFIPTPKRAWIFPWAGAISHVRSFTAAFPGGTEVAREEHAYAVKTQTGSVKFPHKIRETRWQFEGTTVVGGTEATIGWCFKALSGDACTGAEGEFVTQTVTTTHTGNTISNPTYPPGFWGDVPDRAISNHYCKSSKHFDGRVGNR